MKHHFPVDARVFYTGPNRIPIKDCGYVTLNDDEQITFKDISGGEYDITKKSWGYYATPSLNHRLVNFGFKSALVKSEESRYYIFLIHREKLDLFKEYIQSEGHKIVAWLDENKELELRINPIEKEPNRKICICHGEKFTLIHRFHKPSATEKSFKLTSNGQYKRDLMKCDQCGHYRSFHNYNDSDLYSSDYVSTNYGETGLKPVFDKIINLPKEKSDNYWRVERINNFCDQHIKKEKKTALDIGSGLCVFLYQLNKKGGWECTALDPDQRSANHAREVVKINAIHGDFFKILDIQKTFDLVTLNKVLEHVPDPVTMLKKVQLFTHSQSIVYVEVPDGEMAIKDKDGPDREEFTIDHPHVFSMASLLLMGQQAGFNCLKIDRIVEPSTKYTLYAFFQKT